MITEEQLRVLRSAVCHARRRAATIYDEARAKVPDPAVVADLRKPVQDFDGLMRRPWFMVERPERLPQISDFLNFEIALATTDVLRPKRADYDEKFRILQSPRMLSADLIYFRRVGRDAGATAWRSAWPTSTSTTSRATTTCSARSCRRPDPAADHAGLRDVRRRTRVRRTGSAGTSTCCSSPTRRSGEACRSFTMLRARLAQLKFDGLDIPVTASVGMVLIEPDTYLTNHEVVHRAQEAKRRAKDAGRNCVWTYQDWRYERPVRV